jgi:hypothetical protein
VRFLAGVSLGWDGPGAALRSRAGRGAGRVRWGLLGEHGRHARARRCRNEKTRTADFLLRTCFRDRTRTPTCAFFGVGPTQAIGVRSVSVIDYCIVDRRASDAEKGEPPVRPPAIRSCQIPHTRSPVTQAPRMGMRIHTTYSRVISPVHRSALPSAQPAGMCVGLLWQMPSGWECRVAVDMWRGESGNVAPELTISSTHQAVACTDRVVRCQEVLGSLLAFVAL